jgi:hypothetical protein
MACRITNSVSGWRALLSALKAKTGYMTRPAT